MGTLGAALTLVIRLYDNGTLADLDRATAIATASEILLASNVSTTWLACGTMPKPTATLPRGCGRPMERGEVAIRLVRGATPPEVATSLPLGYSLIDMTRKEGRLATIYQDRVAMTSATAGLDVGVLLGRSIAHEIGHLMLGTHDHSDKGLMRALWSRQTLVWNRLDDWLFTPAQGAAIRHALETGDRRQETEVGR
jgi:hypothetical protein